MLILDVLLRVLAVFNVYLVVLCQNLILIRIILVKITINRLLILQIWAIIDNHNWVELSSLH